MKIKNVNVKQVLRLFGFEYEVEVEELKEELNKKVYKGRQGNGEEKEGQA